VIEVGRVLGERKQKDCPNRAKEKGLELESNPVHQERRLKNSNLKS
jgi:hypothetical protein